MIRILLFLIAILTSASAVFPQSRSSLTGQVRDQFEAAVPNARVTVKCVDTDVEHPTTTNHEGYFTLPSLLPLTYTVTAESPGFKPVTSAPQKLDSSTVMRVDLVLVPADSKQVVEVRAQPPALQTANAMVGDTVSAKEMDSIPLQGRNTLELVLTVPGVGGSAGSDEAGIYGGAPTTGAGFNISGGRGASSAILADGANATSISFGRATVTFSPDTVQEIRVITSTFSAQYGVTGGGVISTISKSGTDQLHGNAFWFMRNPALLARNFNSPISSPLRRHEPGATLGGPVWIPKIYDGRRRTFFFASYEPKRWHDGVAVFNRYPTAEERAGDFSNSWVAGSAARPKLYQQVECFPSMANCTLLKPMNRASSTTEYPLFSANDPDPTKRGYVIPKAFIDPNAQKVLNDLPMPNMPYNNLGQNFQGQRGVFGEDNRWNIKVDHNIASANRLSARYTHIPTVADKYLVEKSNMFIGSPTDLTKSQQINITDSHTFSPRIVNEFRGAYSFSDYSQMPSGDVSKVNYTKDKFGLPNTTSWGLPYFDLGGWGVYGNGGSSNTLGKFMEHQYQFSNDLTIVHGRHTFTTGGDLRLMQSNMKANYLNTNCCGTYSFSATATNSGNANTVGGTGGLGFATFLLGIPTSVNIANAVIPFYYRWKTAAAYFQDDFKVTSNLTLNMGLRWQYISTRAEKRNMQAGIDLDHLVPLVNAAGLTTGYTFNYLYSGVNGRSNYLEPVHKKDIEPRFGFAWTPKTRWNSGNDLVIRGGYGISHAPSTGRGRTPIPQLGIGSAGSFGYVQWNGNVVQPRTQSTDPTGVITIGRNAPVMNAVNPLIFEIPKDGVLCVGCSPADPRVPSGGWGAPKVFTKQNATPYIQNWSLNVQKALPQSLVLVIGYMGQKGTHLYSPAVNANQPDLLKYESFLNSGGDPTATIQDPAGRVNSSGNPLIISILDTMRPVPTVGDISVIGLTDSNSIYNAGTFSLERRFATGFGFRFNYTWSKSIDNGLTGNISPSGWDNYKHSLDLKSNRSVSVYDNRHRLNLTMNSELPFGRKKLLLGNANKLVQALVGNWSLNALGSLYSGMPMQAIVSWASTNGIPGLGVSPQRLFPDMVLGQPILNPLWDKKGANTTPYFNPQAFAIPEFGKQGNAARTLDWARAPWKPTLNMSIFKEIRPFENRQRYLQLRGEFFNALNHAVFNVNQDPTGNLFTAALPMSKTGLQFAGPIPNLLGATAAKFPAGSREAVLATYYQQGFGTLPQANVGPGRIIQLALKLYF